MRLCDVEGCDRPFYARDLCSKHYQRLKRTGSPTGSKPRPKRELDPRNKVLHYSRETEPEGCWLWIGGPARAPYGLAHHEGRTISAHRLSFIAFVGPIPDGHQIDHLCRNTRCVNPAHLEAVSAAENVRRERARRQPKTHCLRGHEFTPENTRVHTRKDGGQTRYCRACVNLRSRQRRVSYDQPGGD